MIAQKELFIPTVGTVPLTDWDATVNFDSDYIEFPNSMKDWSIQFSFGGLEVASTAEISLLVSNTYNGEYLPYKPSTTGMVMDTYNNWIVFDSIMPFRYMKIEYIANDTTGSMSIVITK